MVGLDSMLVRNALSEDSWLNCSGFGKHPILPDGRKSQVQRPCLPLDAKIK